MRGGVASHLLSSSGATGTTCAVSPPKDRDRGDQGGDHGFQTGNASPSLEGAPHDTDSAPADLRVQMLRIGVNYHF